MSTDAKSPKPTDPKSLKADAPKTPKLSDAWREARELVSRHRQRLVIGLLLMLVSRGAGLVLPASSKYLIDDVMGKKRTDLLPWLAAAVFGATVIQAVTSFALSQLLGVAAQRAITEMRKRVLAHVTRLPIRYFYSTQTGILISRVMNDADGIRNLVGTGLVQLTGSIVTAVVALVVLLYLNWSLTLITVVILAVFGGGMTVAFQRIRPLFRERGKLYADVSGRLNETLGGIRVVKAYTAEKREQLAFARGVHKLFRNIARTMTGASVVTTFSGIIVGVVGVIMILIGGRAVLAGTMTIGGFVMYLAFTGMLASPLVQLASIGTQITEAFAGLDRIREIESMAAEDEGDAARTPLPSIRGDVRFEGVDFEYKVGTPVLKAVSLTAPAGTTTALVGSSGSGKTTLIGLIMAFHRPTAGRIVIDGHDLASVRLRDYRSHLGVVLQDNFLFDGTVAENIAFSRPTATRAEIEQVSRIAHCDEFVDTFPQGYDTVVGERGVRLSGGQRQRVAIARAILASPGLLILDEATSSLDSESESLIQDGLRTLRQGRTTFVIAHRLSTIRSADQILVLEQGEIVERGTHAELMALHGRYRHLHDKQYSWETDLFINPGEDFTPEPAPAGAARAGGERSRLPAI
jgi:subfamily B ATP-binding cassette protein MsbA